MSFTTAAVVLVVLGSLSLVVPVPSPSIDFYAHAPITIGSNSDFTATNGVTGGSGTASDPFVISGWNIEVPPGGAYGVSIRDVTVPFVLTDINVVSYDSQPWSNTNYGVEVQNVTYARLQDVAVRGFYWGVFVARGRFDLAVVESDGAYYEAFSAIGIHNSTFTNLAATNSEWGIHIHGSHHVRVTNSSFYRLNASVVGALEVWHSSDILIQRNYVSLPPNRQSTRGVLVYNSTNVSILRNDFWYPWRGFELGQVHNVSLVQNNVTFSDTPVVLTTQIPGRPDAPNAGIIAYHNNFLNYTQAIDNDGDYWGTWDLGYPAGGNYWSGYDGPDACRGAAQTDCSNRDGLGDTAYYSVWGPGSDAFVDHYPFVRPYPLPVAPPIARVSAIPSPGFAEEAIELNASSSSDARDVSTQLQVRWDFEGDGEWDTPWTSNLTTSHTYSAPGTHRVNTVVRNTAGLMSYANFTMEVSPSRNLVAVLTPPLAIGGLAAVGVVLFVTLLVRRLRTRP